jgi:hypothetical protein
MSIIVGLPELRSWPMIVLLQQGGISAAEDRLGPADQLTQPGHFGMAVEGRFR